MDKLISNKGFLNVNNKVTKCLRVENSLDMFGMKMQSSSFIIPASPSLYKHAGQQEFAPTVEPSINRKLQLSVLTVYVNNRSES